MDLIRTKRITTGYDSKLDLNNPETFNDKLKWLKLHDRNPIYPDMTDKLTARNRTIGRINNTWGHLAWLYTAAIIKLIKAKWNALNSDTSIGVS